MKNIFKRIMTIAVGTLVVFSCDYDDNEWDKLHNHAPDPSAGFYVQFDDNTLNTQIEVDENNNPIDIESTFLVELMGLPQNEAVTATISRDPSSTMTADMYTLSTTSVTIPAGETSASVLFKSVAANMPICDYVTLILNLDAGANTTPSDPGNKVVFTMRKISPSPLPNGVADLEGGYKVTKSYWKYVEAPDEYTEQDFNTSFDGTNLVASGLGQEFIVKFWYEAVVAGGTCNIIANEDGTIDIPRQYIFTTVYSGTEYDYEIEGTGIWYSLCGEAPVMKLKYDIYYEGDADGLASIYGPGYLGSTYLGGDFVLK